MIIAITISIKKANITEDIVLNIVLTNFIISYPSLFILFIIKTLYFCTKYAFIFIENESVAIVTLLFPSDKEYETLPL